MSVAKITSGGGVISSTVPASSTKNDSGKLTKAGTVASSRWSNQTNLDNAYLGLNPIQVNSGNGIAKIVSAGNFATMTKGRYIIRKVTSTIAGVANTTLLTGASDFGERQSINKIESVRNTFLHALTWTSDKDGQPTYSFTKTDSLDNFAQDDAARPSLAVPGELVYRTGSPSVTLADYSEKTG